jgi:quinol monooxygenase YgiN
VVTTSLSFRVQPQSLGEVLSVVGEIAERMRRSTGCRHSRLFSDVDDPHAFVFVSEWPDTHSAKMFFLSREFRVFRGIRLLLRNEPLVVLSRPHDALPQHPAA